ncbi:MAG: FHA domain-containing protein, partial [Acidobacteriota bacterium]
SSFDQIHHAMWTLRDDNGLTFRLTRGSVKTIGRAVRADFVVDAALVSRVHCRVSVQPDGRLEVQDLESTNGTFVNGKKVDCAVLKDGDELGVGRVTLKVEKVH